MDELAIGLVYQFKVIDINENYDSFQGNVGIRYCHAFCLEKDGEEYNCQICTESTTQNFCNIGDTISAKISKLNKKLNQYTLESIIVSPSSAKRSPSVSKPSTPGPNIPQNNNILLRGSAAEIALQQSVQYTCKASQMPGEDFMSIDDVLKNADKIYDWLLKKNKQN